MENVRETILDDAKHAVCGDRDHQYGSPEDNFDQIARFWSAYLHTNLSSCDIANMMILFKLARNMTGEPKLDNWVDIAGYAACGADCQCYLVNKKGATKMKLERMMEIKTNDIHVGDRIHVGKYTATCQEITSKGALFFLDQYLDKPFPMNRNNTNNGGYPESDLRKALQSDEVLNIFADIRDYMVPFDNGDLLRIPFFGEIFGQEDAEYFYPDGCEQWELMKDRKNRIAFRQNCWEWGWLQNKRKGSALYFCSVHAYGSADSWDASRVLGVRPVFQIANEIYKKKEISE